MILHAIVHFNGGNLIKMHTPDVDRNLGIALIDAKIELLEKTHGKANVRCYGTETYLRNHCSMAVQIYTIDVGEVNIESLVSKNKPKIPSWRDIK